MLSEKLRQYRPLIILIALIIAGTLIRQFMYGFSLHDAMYDFMGITFFVFGAIKLLNWQGFIDAFRSYDFLAQQSYWFAAIYPFIEMSLGVLYWFRMVPVFTNILTIILTGIGAISVARELKKDRPVPCACMGAVFVLPMTWVTLFEDLFMFGMAVIMLFWMS